MSHYIYSNFVADYPNKKELIKGLVKALGEFPHGKPFVSIGKLNNNAGDTQFSKFKKRNDHRVEWAEFPRIIDALDADDIEFEMNSPMEFYRYWNVEPASLCAAHAYLEEPNYYLPHTHVHFWFPKTHYFTKEGWAEADPFAENPIDFSDPVRVGALEKEGKYGQLNVELFHHLHVWLIRKMPIQYLMGWNELFDRHFFTYYSYQYFDTIERFRKMLGETLEELQPLIEQCQAGDRKALEKFAIEIGTERASAALIQEVKTNFHHYTGLPSAAKCEEIFGLYGYLLPDQLGVLISHRENTFDKGHGELFWDLLTG